MHGNVRECCRDLYGSYTGGSVTDLTDATTGNKHVLRGGGWAHTPNIVATPIAMPMATPKQRVTIKLPTSRYVLYHRKPEVFIF